MSCYRTNQKIKKDIKLKGNYYFKKEDYVLRKISEYIFLVSTNKPVNGIWMYELNTIGSLIWKNCDIYKANELAEQLNEQYFNKKLSVDEKTSINSFVGELEKMGLIKRYAI